MKILRSAYYFVHINILTHIIAFSKGFQKRLSKIGAAFLAIGCRNTVRVMVIILLKELALYSLNYILARIISGIVKIPMYRRANVK